MPVVCHVRTYSSSHSHSSLCIYLRSNVTTPEPEEHGFEQDILNRYLTHYIRRTQYAQIGRDYDSVNPPAIFPPPLLPANEIFVCHSPQYADQWPIGFQQPGEWMRIWKLPLSFKTALEDCLRLPTLQKIYVDDLELHICKPFQLSQSCDSLDRTAR